MEKKNKVRTSITIDPDLLNEVRREAASVPQSVSSYMEKALRFYRAHGQKLEPVDSSVVVVP